MHISIENMKIQIQEVIEVPFGIQIEIENKLLKIKKDNLNIERKIKGNFNIKLEGSKIILSNTKSTKKEKRNIKSNAAHIRNLLNGLNKKYIYRLQVCFVHFPVTISLQGKELVIKNFLGEKRERRAKILDNVDVKIDKEFIKLESYDKEAAGQTAANIETSTKIRKKDRRIFQDGIFITEKSKGRQGELR